MAFRFLLEELVPDHHECCMSMWERRSKVVKERMHKGHVFNLISAHRVGLVLLGLKDDLHFEELLKYSKTSQILLLQSV